MAYPGYAKMIFFIFYFNDCLKFSEFSRMGSDTQFYNSDPSVLPVTAAPIPGQYSFTAPNSETFFLTTWFGARIRFVQISRRWATLGGIVNDDNVDVHVHLPAWVVNKTSLKVIGNLKIENLKIENLKIEKLKIENFKIENLKIKNLIIENLKIENLKIENFKLENLKIENLKIENLKIENLKIENLKIENFWTISKLKISEQSQNWKFLENLKIEISGKSYIEISGKSQNWNFWTISKLKFLENLKIENPKLKNSKWKKKVENLLKISNFWILILKFLL